MKVFSVSGYDCKGNFHQFYHEAENIAQAAQWVDEIGFNYTALDIHPVCAGGYEALKRQEVCVGG